MPRQSTPFFTTAVTASLTNASETVIATLNGCSVSFPSDHFVIEAFADITLDASVTGVTFKVRRTSISGTIVGTFITTPKAAADFTRLTFSMLCSDAPGDVANLTYVLTATATAAGGASTVNNAGIVAGLTS